MNRNVNPKGCAEHVSTVEWHRRRTRHAVAAAALVVVATVLTSCSSSGGSDTKGTAGSASSQSSAASAPADSSDPVAAAKANVAKYSAKVTSYPSIPAVSGGIAGLKGKSLWYVPLGGSLPIFQGFGSGIKQAAEAAGMTFHTCDGALVPTTMVSCLNQAATQGAAGVIGGYIDYSEAPTAYDALAAKNIPVVIGGEPPTGGKSNSKQLAFYDATEAATIASGVALDSVIADSNGKAHILFMGISDTKSTTSEAQAAKSHIAKACPDCTFNLVMYNTSSLSKVPSLASSALISNPDTNYVVVQVDSGEPATIQGIQSAGFANKVKLVAISGTLPTLQKIKSGDTPTQLADVGISPVYTGWQWTDALIRMLSAQSPHVTPAVIRLFTKENVQDLTLTPAAFQTNAWYGPDTYRDTFREAWGVQ
jgi:ribose transport system substrate-binding protein